MAAEKVAAVEVVDVDRYDAPASRFGRIAAGGSTKSDAISVEQYTEDRDLYEAIVASLLQSRPRGPSDGEGDGDGDGEDVRFLGSVPAGARLPSSRKRKRPYSGASVAEPGQASNSQPDRPFTCEICVETRTGGDLFRIKGCSHAYCNDCVTKYIASKLHDNVTRIGCPVSDCGGVLEPEHCRSILPPELFDRWGNALCEAVISEGEKFYCPFRDCSALMIHDGDAAAMTLSECSNCWRLFCVQCKVPWHAGVECQEFQGLKEGEREREDIMLKKLAESQRWKRCPKCSFYVQKVDGCAFVKCRCRAEFCYRCGAEAKVSHYCQNCRC